MVTAFIISIVCMAVLVISTDQFVHGASRVAEGLRVSPVLVGALILGCGTGLPELALAFERDHGNPWRDLFGVGEAAGSVPIAIVISVLVVILVIPALFPNLLPKHSPVILGATILFAALLRGSLDIYEGVAMLLGFGLGLAAIVRADRNVNDDPFAPIIHDDYGQNAAYREMPVMSATQLGVTRCLLGLLGTAISAQVLARSVENILVGFEVSATFIGITFVIIGSVLPHVVVAIQALKRNEHGLAVGNLIGSNLFQSLVIGGLVAVIRPYEEGGAPGFASFGIAAATAVLTWILLHAEDEMSRKQGLALLGAYVALVALAVP